MEYGKETWDAQKKPPTRAIEFPDSQAAIDGLLDDWLPNLIDSNEILTAALVRVKGFCLTESSSLAAERVLAEVEVALERATSATKGLLARPGSAGTLIQELSQPLYCPGILCDMSLVANEDNHHRSVPVDTSTSKRSESPPQL
jgi:hypothetical protein